MRPPTGLATTAWEVWGRLVSAPARGGAKLPIRSNKLSINSGSHSLHTSSSAAAAGARAGTSSANPSVEAGVRSFARSVYEGVFKSIKTPYNHPHGPYTTAPRLGVRQVHPQPRGVATFRGNHSARRPTSSSFHPRPAALPGRYVGQQGLGSARNFSSTQPLFANVVQNVPLGLRALGGLAKDKLDDRTWRKVRRDLRKAQTKLVSVEDRQSRLEEAFLSKKDEMNKYFSSLPLAFNSVVEAEHEVEQSLEPIVLILSVEPFFSFPVSASSFHPSDLDDHRLLSPSVLQTFSSIERAYARHAIRIRALHDRLVHAGVFDDVEHVTTEAVAWRDPVDGREKREVHVSFDRRYWTRADVRSAVGEWEEEGDWWRIVGGDEVGSSEWSESNESDVETQDLVMPCPSQILESEADEGDLFFSNKTDSPVGSTSPVESWNDASPGVLFDYRIDDDGSSAAWDDETRSYEEGVRTFLDDLDRFGQSYERE